MTKRFSYLRLFFILFIYGHLVLNIICSIILLMAAKHNYPGGEALNKLNNLEHLVNRTDVHVHICNLAAQTGVTKFLEVHQSWIYNKTEGLEDDYTVLESSNFTHLIVELGKSNHTKLLQSFTKILELEAFVNLKFHPNWKFWNLITLQTKPQLAIYERNSYMK